MFCCYSQKGRRERALNNEIDREMKKHKKLTLRGPKVLVLGTGECGKSTFMKQMQIINGSGFTRQQKLAGRIVVIQNIVDSLIKLNNQIYIRGLVAEVKVDISEVIQAGTDLMPHHVPTISSFWLDPVIQRLFALRGQFHLLDSFEYFMANLERILAENYCPNNQDLLHSRKPTTGVHEYRFLIDNVSFLFVDVGGQRSERKNWIHCFSSMTAIIFITACSEFDQMLIETQKNRLEESLALFRALLGHSALCEMAMILFLNKIDLIESKLQVSSLAEYWPGYSGGRYDTEAALDYILSLFLVIGQEFERQMFFHKTLATDTRAMSQVFLFVKVTVIESNVQRYYFI